MTTTVQRVRLSSHQESITGFNPKIEREVEALGIPAEDAAELAMNHRPRISLIDAALILSMMAPK